MILLRYPTFPSVNRNTVLRSRLLVKLPKKYPFVAASTTWYSHSHPTHTLFFPFFLPCFRPQKLIPEIISLSGVRASEPPWQALLGIFIGKWYDYYRSLLVIWKRQARGRERVSANTSVAGPQYVDWKTNLQLYCGLTFVFIRVDFTWLGPKSNHHSLTNLNP